METIDSISAKAACPICDRAVWVEMGHIEEHGACAGSGHPVGLERCAECDAGTIYGHAGPHGHFCSCTDCSDCAGTSVIATILSGPAVPFELDHPRNAPPAAFFEALAAEQERA